MSEDFNALHRIETYKSLITVSIEAKRFLALVNGGAAIALLNYATSVVQKVGHAPDVRWPMALFLAGLVLCGWTFLASYWTQNILFNESMGRVQRNSHRGRLGSRRSRPF